MAIPALPAITESDRRLLELARVYRSDAALAVQFGLLTGEVQRRLDTLAAMLGIPSRQALRELDPAALPLAATATPTAATAAQEITSTGPIGAAPKAANPETDDHPRTPAHRRRPPAAVNAAAGLLVLVAIAVVLVRSGDAAPVTLPAIGSTPLDTIAGAAIAPPDRVARLERSIPFPAGTEVLAVVEDDGGTRTLVRIWRPAEGGTRIDPLLAPPAGDELTSAVPFARGGELWAAVCEGCRGDGPARTVALRSSDGGVTWTAVRSVEGRAIITDAGRDTPTLMARPSATLPLAPTLAIEATGSAVIDARVVHRQGMPDVVLASWLQGTDLVTGVFRGEGQAAGELLASWHVPAGTVMAGFLYGSEGRPILSVPPGVGAIEIETAPGVYRLRPALLDFDSGIIRPIDLPRASPIGDRASIRPIAVREGQLSAVVAAGGCVDIKASPEDGSERVDCLPGGALVSLVASRRNAPGWQSVVTPAGKRGWMPATDGLAYHSRITASQ